MLQSPVCELKLSLTARSPAWTSRSHQTVNALLPHAFMPDGKGVFYFVTVYSCVLTRANVEVDPMR